MTQKPTLHVELEREGDSELFDDLQRYLNRNPRLTRFLFNPAGFTFFIGVFLFIGMSLGAVGIWLVDPVAGRAVLDTNLAQLIGGREPAIPLGLERGLPVLLVFGICTTQDLITTAWIYPLFYFTRKNSLMRNNFIGFLFQKLAKKAEKNKKFVERYGALGLFAFMLIPFAVNGPLIGAIIGKLAGIRTRYILPAVFLSTIVATAAWSALWFFSGDDVNAFLTRYDLEGIITPLMLGLVVVFMLMSLMSILSDLRRFRLIQQRDRERLRRAQHQDTLYATESNASTEETPAGPGSL